MKKFAIALFGILLALPVFAEQVPGTSVYLTPPEGFVAADRFPGFMEESTGSSIMISEIPDSLKGVTDGFNDSNRMQAQGLKLISKSLTKVDGHTAMLFHMEQTAYGTRFKKWALAVDRSGSTTFILATFPETVAEQQGENLKALILNAKFGQPDDPTAALNFTFEPVAPFRVAKVIGQNVMLSLDGQFPPQKKNTPIMILGLSVSENLAISDQKAFAEQRITKTATVENIRVRQSTSVKIGDLFGYATTAEGVRGDATTPLTIYQVLLVDKSGYSLMVGITPTAQEDNYIPIFKQIAKTFRMKEAEQKATAESRPAVEVVRSFLIAMFSNDQLGIRNEILPNKDAEILWQAEKVPAEALAQIKRQMESMTCRECTVGETIKLNNGRTLRLTNQYVNENSKLLFPKIGGEEWPFPLRIVKINGGWKVDAEPLISARLAAKRAVEQ